VLWISGSAFGFANLTLLIAIVRAEIEVRSKIAAGVPRHPGDVDWQFKLDWIHRNEFWCSLGVIASLTLIVAGFVLLYWERRPRGRRPGEKGEGEQVKPKL
jgi:hypothetical protein